MLPETLVAPPKTPKPLPETNSFPSKTPSVDLLTKKTLTETPPIKKESSETLPVVTVKPDLEAPVQTLPPATPDISRASTQVLSQRLGDHRERRQIHFNRERADGGQRA